MVFLEDVYMPIIGHGDIASVLTDHPDRIYFASGVSNSQESRESEYRREVDLLMAQPEDKRLVYFGSLSIFYSNTRYAQHKRFMEGIVKTWPRYCLVRIGNIDFGTNPHTIINFFKAQVAKGRPLVIKDEERYVAGEEELLHWISRIPDFNCEMNIPGERLTIRQIAERYADI